MAKTGSGDRFGYEWSVYSEMLPLYEEQFLRWTAALGKEEWQGRSFLDVGCGMGRNSYWAMKCGAGKGTAIDIDERTLESARKTLSGFAEVTVLNMSAYEMPFIDEFDIVFCIGVLHHLESPDVALAKMVRAARQGGRILLWVYGLENNEWIVKLFNPLRKLVFSRLPVDMVHVLSLFPAAFLWCLLRLMPSGLEYFRLLRTFSFQHLRSIVFDQMLPQIANYWSREQVEEMMRRAGLTDIQLQWVNQISWSAIGTKTLDPNP